MAKKDKVSDPGASASFFNKEGQPVLDALLKETERGQPLIAAAFLDNALRGCILALCKKEKVSEDVKNLLLGEYSDKHSRAIIADFGAKIPVCRAFGLFGDEEYKALHAIHQIRNLCAHSDFKVTLRGKKSGESQRIRSHIDTLRAWLKGVEHKSMYEAAGEKPIPGWIRDLNLAGQTVTNPPSPRHVFVGAVTMLYTMLHNLRWQIRNGEYDGAIWITNRGKGP